MIELIMFRRIIQEDDLQTLATRGGLFSFIVLYARTTDASVNIKHTASKTIIP